MPCLAQINQKSWNTNYTSHSIKPQTRSDSRCSSLGDKSAGVTKGNGWNQLMCMMGLEHNKGLPASPTTVQPQSNRSPTAVQPQSSRSPTAVAVRFPGVLLDMLTAVGLLDSVPMRRNPRLNHSQSIMSVGYTLKLTRREGNRLQEGDRVVDAVGE